MLHQSRQARSHIGSFSQLREDREAYDRAEGSAYETIIRTTRHGDLPCRPAAWQIEAISAELSLSGLETTASEINRDQPSQPFILRASTPPAPPNILTVFQIHIRAQVHLPRNGLEDQPSLSSRRPRELDLPIQSTGT